MRKLIINAIIGITIIILMSCNSTDKSRVNSPKIYKTKTGKTITVIETHPVGQSLSNIEIKTIDFEHNFPETYENVDPIADVFVADLDNNNFDEIYIVTISSGSGNYGRVMGFASNKDKSLSMINFPEIKEDEKIFEGYMGHDIFSIVDKKLVRVFPIYQKDNTNQNPTGGKRKLVYGLYPGEAMWQLKIEEQSRFEPPEK